MWIPFFYFKGTAGYLMHGIVFGWSLVFYKNPPEAKTTEESKYVVVVVLTQAVVSGTTINPVMHVMLRKYSYDI